MEREAAEKNEINETDIDKTNIKEVDEEEELRRRQRAERRKNMIREKERMMKINKLIRLGGIPAVLFLLAAVIITVSVVHAKSRVPEDDGDKQSVENIEKTEYDEDYGVTLSYQGAEEELPDNVSANGNEVEISNPTTEPLPAPVVVDDKVQVGEVWFKSEMAARTTSGTVTNITEEVQSNYSILINEADNTIVVQKDAKTRINPASMTKVLTVLVAAEHVADLDDRFTVTIDMTDYAYKNDCSSVGFLVDEEVTIRDLFYGTILPSGGDAAIALATYVAGSHEAFVDMMNEKLEQLGLSETAHFTNCVGLYDKEHYCTAYDMAIIMKAAVENDLCREVLSEHTYTTSATEQHPEGITISNWFLRRIEDKDSGGLVLCGKTGFVNQSGSCAVSYFISNDNVPYICVTADTYSSWRCIYDHVALYKTYTNS